MNVLREQAETHPARAHNVSAIRSLFITDEAKDSRLPSAVPAHKPSVLTRIYLHGRATQDILRAVRFMNV